MPVILTQVVDYLYREKKTILNIYGEVQATNAYF
jgi:hypothetical protein